jgi:RsiW-degrading membrane proteinase PrsW (M82 family)
LNLPLALVGALPALAAMIAVDRLDARRPEPPWSLRKLALAGALSVVPCFFVEQLLARVGPSGGWPGVLWSAFVVAAATEELAKVLCVRWIIWHRPEFDERIDGIVYAARAGLGFALVENVAYLMTATTPAGYVGMYIGRALLAVPGHAIWAGMMGYYAARRRFDGDGPGLLGGWLLATLLHGVYDAAIFGMPLVARDREWVAVALIVVPLAVIGWGAVALRRMARRAVALDDLAHARVAAVTMDAVGLR